jgi:hypothetical protein
MLYIEGDRNSAERAVRSDQINELAEATHPAIRDVSTGEGARVGRHSEMGAGA